MTSSNDILTDDTLANNLANLRGKIMRLIDIKPEDADELLEQLRRHSRKLKGSPMLSKWLLRNIFEVIRALEASAPMMGSKKAIALQYAGRFERLFGLILEDKSDLNVPPPGVPRAF
jgi:hypothetical protein